jgi:enamine deaminase RidA (YjgF/YER057c/UK114 family)
VAPLVWLAGQIGLEPATMTLPPSARTQTALALRHCAQVLFAVGASASRLVSAVIYWQAQFWRDEQPLIRAVLLPLIEHRLRQSDGRTLSLVHVAVPALPRDALVEVQLIGASSPHTQTAAALALIAHAPEAASQLQSPLLLRCPLHATLSPGAFASIWSAITVEHQTPVGETDSAHPSLDPSASLSLLVRTVDDSFASSRLDWSHVLVCRLYLSPLLCERDVRIALHRALAERGVVRVPAVSFLRVQCVRLQAATAGADQARTLLAAHIMLVADATSNQTDSDD